jgi:hypothetical protein
MIAFRREHARESAPRRWPRRLHSSRWRLRRADHRTLARFRSGAQSGQAEHHFCDGRLGQHGVGLPPRLRRLRRRRGSHTAATACNAAARPAHRDRIHVQSVRSARSGSSYNGVFYDPAALYRPGKKADGTNLPCAASDTTCGAPWTPSTTTASPGIEANTGTTIDRRRAIGHRLVLEILAHDIGKADGRHRRLGLQNRRVYGAVTISGTPRPRSRRATTTRTRRSRARVRRNAGSSIASTSAAPTITIAQVQFCSARTRPAGAPPRASASGTDDLPVRPLRHRRRDLRSAGVLASTSDRRLSRQQGRRRNPSGRTYAQEMANFANWYAFYRTRILAEGCLGIAFSALDQNSRVGFHRSGRMPPVHERQGLHGREQADLVLRTRSVPAARRSQRHRGASASSMRKSRRHRPSRRDGSARSGDGQVPAQLPSAVDRRLLELDAVVHGAATTT